MIGTAVRWSALILVFLAAALTLTTQVFAHADYERSAPDRNEVVPESPEQLDVYFTQDIRKTEGANSLIVLDETGAQVNLDDGIVDDDDRLHMFTELPSNLPPGRYVVEWMTLSDLDDDDASGAFCFYVAVEPTEEQAAECAEFDAEQQGPTTTPPSADPTELDGATPPAADETPTAPADGANDDDDGVSAGVIVAIVIGVIVVVLAVGAAAYWLRRA